MAERNYKGRKNNEVTTFHAKKDGSTRPQTQLTTKTLLSIICRSRQPVGNLSMP
jgi:hypothetical protein